MNELNYKVKADGLGAQQKILKHYKKCKQINLFSINKETLKKINLLFG